MTRIYSLASIAVLAAACSRATPEQQIVNDAAAALGGRDRLLAVKTLVIEGDGTNGNLGQDMTPEATGQAFVLKGYKRAIDVAGGRVRIEQTRTPNFAYFQGSQPQTQVLGIDGDVAVETTFSDYQDVAGLKLPSRLTTKTDKYTTADIRVSRQTVDADVGNLAAPAAAVSAAPIAGPPPATVTAEELSKGIWLLAGQSHHSVLVEFADHLTLIEAPQNDTRALAVIAKARELRPDKPLTQVVNTHHHFDHSGGIRAAVSEGLAVVTHKGNVAFFQNAVARAHTHAPDALAKNPKPIKIETVDEVMHLKDATM